MAQNFRRKNAGSRRPINEIYVAEIYARRS